MSSKAPVKSSDQSKRFEETARELGCDEDEAAFDEKLRVIAGGARIATQHWSDCAVFNGPALPSGACDCGGLKLAEDADHNLVVAPVAVARRKGALAKKS